MNTSVDIIEDAFDPRTMRTVEGNDVIEILQNNWETFPPTAHLYHGYVSVDTDVTPSNQHDVEVLRKTPGKYIVVIYPGAAIPMLVWYVVAALAVATLAMVLFKPKVPSARNVQSESSNNALANRTNNSRPKARIPDIFGRVRAYPDLIQLAYSFWQDNLQVEETLMCLGRGEYEVHDVKESDTDVSEVPGEAISLWKPNRDIEVDAADATYGTTTHGVNPVWDNFGAAIVRRSNSVDGLTLDAGNNNSFSGSYRFFPDGVIQAPQTIGVNKGLDFTKLFEVGQNVRVQITNPGTTNLTAAIRMSRVGLSSSIDIIGTPDVQSGDLIEFTPSLFIVNDIERDFAGRYTVTSVSLDFENGVTTVNLDNPVAVNPNWVYVTSENPSQYKESTVTFGVFDEDYGYLRGTYEVTQVAKLQITLDVGTAWAALPGGGSPTIQGVLMGSNESGDTGPFTVSGAQGVRGIMLNFFAGQGMYKDDGENQTATNVIVEVTVSAFNASNVQIGPTLTENVTVVGSATDQKSKGATALITVPEASYYRVNATRVTPKDTDFKGQVVDEVKWRDLYSISPVNQSAFGDVTILRVTTRVTDSALTSKERKLNMEVTRKISVRDVNGDFSTDLRPTKYIGDILHHICVDPYIGNRQPNEIDVNQMYAICLQAYNYFGVIDMTEFCYTFDKANMSFEDTIQTVSSAGLMTAYRQGQLIKLAFEYENAPSRLLFNHRNKMPGSEKRTYQFARENNYDGVQFSYVSPEDDSLQTIYLPDDAALNPRKIESVGIRSEKQAHIHAWREWNRIKYRSVLLEFEGLAETESVIPPQCILVADNTKSSTIDGYVVSQTGLSLTLSQYGTFDLTKQYSIILQMSDGSIETIAITPSAEETNVVLLANASLRAIITDLDYVAQTSFFIVSNDDVNIRKYILTERDSGDSTSNTYPVSAINYDARYYANDKDYAEGVDSTWLNSLGDLILWLDASDVDTIVAPSASQVTQWIDKSDAMNDAQQPIVVLRPLLDTTVIVPRSVSFIDEL